MQPTAGTEDGLQPPTPLFPDAIERWDAGDPMAALRVLDRDAASGADRGLEELVLRASLRAAAGDHLAAGALWRTVIERAVFMRTFARRALVESLLARDALDEVGPVLAELTGSDAVRHLDLVVRVADAHLAAGDTRRADELYRRAIAARPRGALADAARLGWAAGLEASGDPAAAAQLLRETKLRHRDPDTFDAAHQGEQRLARRTGVESVPLTPTQYRTLVRRLRAASRFDSALAMVDEWHAAHGGAEGSARIEAERIETLYAQRANAAAVEACGTFYRRFPRSSLIPDVRLTDFRLAVRMVDTARARRLGLELWEGRVPGATADNRWDAGNLLAAYLVAVGDVAGGLDLYPQLFAIADSADRQRELLWRAGVASLRVGRTERALTNLRALLDRNPGDDLLPAGLYWLAIAESEDDASGATERLRNVARRFPYHYYGLRARQALAARGAALSPGEIRSERTFPRLRVSSAWRDRAEYRAAMVLARAGLRRDSAWYLRRLLDRRQGDRALALLAARASAAAGDHASVFRILVNYFGAFLLVPADELPSDFWSMVYPRPFWDDVGRWGRAHQVDPLLLTSLMRRESRFDPGARSAVGAVGLFQIMPYTADALAERAGVGDILEHGLDDATLMRPLVNSAIAARLTADLLELFDGAVAPVVASYNAGEERVAVWWESSRHISEAMFVDTIPYSETRRFAREVLANHAAYRRLYADPSP